MKNTHPAIIDMETFSKANSQLKKNAVKTNRIKDYKGFLDGLVRCGECGKPMNVSGQKKESGRIVYSFYCTDGKNKNKICNNNKIIYTKKLEEIVYFHIKNILDNLDDDEIVGNVYKSVKYRTKMTNKIEGIRQQIEIGKKKIKEIYIQKVEGKLSLEEFIQSRQQINEKNEELEKQIIELTNDIDMDKQKEQASQIYIELKKENNLMKYINDLVKEIKFYSDRRIEIKVY